MQHFLYPTEVTNECDWIEDMILGWQNSKKGYLCFPFIRFQPHTVPSNTDFSMFMYYRKGATSNDYLKGKIRFRMHVVDVSTTIIEKADVHIQRFSQMDEARIWFLCDKIDEVRKTDGSLLSLHDFVHQEGKKLTSTIRNSIAPVSCLLQDLRIRRSCP